MRILIVLALAFFPLTPFVMAQQGMPGEWTWMNGPSSTNQPPSFGVQGVADPANHPPPCHLSPRWTGRDGRFWLYGGGTEDSLFGIHEFADLWRFDPSTNLWTWIHGPAQVAPSAFHGTKGIADPANLPGVAGVGTFNWTDADGNLWMIRGGMLRYNSLWKYDIAARMWTWMSGDTIPYSSGHYGVKGVPAPDNRPKGRYQSSAAWTDSAGNFWMFGGAVSSGLFEDMWRFDVSSLEWTWMNGSSGFNAPSIYGVKGVSSPLNRPGGRTCDAYWQDEKGNFWIWGGYTAASSAAGKNDLWMYNPSINEWTWMAGSELVTDTGYYGIRCEEDLLAHPPPRSHSTALWTDSCNSFFLMGGYFSDGLDYFFRDDMWRYDADDNLFSLVSGSSSLNLTGSYGVQGVSDPANKPPPRCGPASWIDQYGNQWMYGGYTYPANIMSDMWRFTPDTSCVDCVYEPPCEKDFFIPNVFTPNSDGKNDAFYIKDFCAQNDFGITIYNRWGIEVYKSVQYDFQWRGECPDGPVCTDGIYFYILKTSSKNYRGYIHLVAGE